jgi:ligand-binding sensor domain-containing protein
LSGHLDKLHAMPTNSLCIPAVKRLSASDAKVTILLGHWFCLLIVLLGCSVAAFAVDPSSTITQYGHKAWRVTEDGLTSVPESIAQTSDGYIWVGTVNGLFRFDGIRFTLWTPQGGETFQGREIDHLYGSRDGSLYIGSYDGLTRLSDGHVHQYKGRLRRPGPFVEGGDGQVWFTHTGTFTDSSAFCSVKGEKVTCYGRKDGIACMANDSILPKANGDILVGGERGICSWGGAGKADEVMLPGLAQEDFAPTVAAMAEDKSGRLWAGVSATGRGRGLLQYTDSHWTSYITNTIDGRRLNIQRLMVDNRGSLWIGTANDGVYRLVQGRLDHFNSADGLTGNRVTELMEDREGSVWVVTNRGVDQFHDLPVISFTSREGLFADHATALAASSDGAVWVGNQNALDVIRNGHVSSVLNKQVLHNSTIDSLLEDNRGRLWVATGRQLAVYSEGRFQVIKDLQGHDLSVIYTLAEDSHHDIWASLQRGHTQTSRDRPATILDRIRGLKADYETSTPEGQVSDQSAPDSNGGLWLGVYTDGLFQFRAGRSQRADFIDKDATVSSLWPEDGGALWVGTYDGVTRAERGRAQTLNKENGLPCNAAYGLIEDQTHSLWIEMQCGLVRIANSELLHWWNDAHYKPQFILFDTTSGFTSAMGVSPPVRSKDGRLWFLGDYIVYVIDPGHIPRNTLVPPVKIERFVADHREYPVDHVSLPRLIRNIEIDFAGLSYVLPEAVQFRYKLDGHDRQWIEAGTRRQAFYNDLGPGQYRFHVLACNNNRVWNETGATLIFNIPPAWYQTYWFRVSCVIILVWLTSMMYLARMRKYAHSVKVRFDERLSERTRLARELHDTLLQTIQGSKLVADGLEGYLDDLPRAKQSLAKLSQWLSQAMNEGRAALESLRNSAPSEDLSEALRHTANECAPNSMRVFVTVTGKVCPIHPVARDEVYRIAFEAIRNACVHSNGSAMTIGVSYGRDLTIQIHDNGGGFDPDLIRTGKPGHFGIKGMKERASKIGARLSLQTSVKDGTQFSLHIPGRVMYRSPERGWRWLLSKLTFPTPKNR